MSKYFLVGSNYFFKHFYADFKSKDIDRVILINNPVGFTNVRQTTVSDSCLFEWRNMTADEFVEVTLQTKTPMCVGKFLVPEFANAIGFTLDHLKQLEPIVDKLDDDHLYEKKIYNFYLLNNSMTLTPTQRDEVYQEYCRTRRQ